jgi:hypothetical protein
MAALKRCSTQGATVRGPFDFAQGRLLKRRSSTVLQSSEVKAASA